jgi:hypothetical protein
MAFECIRRLKSSAIIRRRKRLRRGRKSVSLRSERAGGGKRRARRAPLDQIIGGRAPCRRAGPGGCFASGALEGLARRAWQAEGSAGVKPPPSLRVVAGAARSGTGASALGATAKKAAAMAHRATPRLRKRRRSAGLPQWLAAGRLGRSLRRRLPGAARRGGRQLGLLPEVAEAHALG